MAERVMSADEVRRRATAPLIAGETIDLRNLSIDGPLDLAGVAIANVDFSGTQFRGPVSFARAECRGLTWLRDCRFDGAVTFARALFENDCRFDGAIGTADLDFSGCEFRGAAAFDHCRLKSSACFDHAVVYGNLSFANASVAGSLSLRHATCHGGLWLDDVELSNLECEGLEVHGRLWLRNATGAKASGIVTYGYVYR